VAIQIQGNGGTVAEVDGTTFRALRVTARPFEALGFYAFAGQTGTYAGLGAAAILFSSRWGDATRLAVLTAAKITVLTTVVFTAAQRIDRDLVIVRSFTVADTGQTAVTLTGNNQKKRTSYGTSLVSDMRIAGGGAITAGTGTADAQAVGIGAGWAPASTGTNGGLGEAILNRSLLEDQGDHPIIFAQNEGYRIRIPTAMGAGGSQITYPTIEWAEVNAY
jgi:hypothetical protein